jgi:methionyl-tRNA synthetase
LTKRRKKRSQKCAHCGQRFEPPKRGRPPRYCCPSHRQQAYVTRLASRQNLLRLAQEDRGEIRRKDEMRRERIALVREFGVDLGPPQPAPTPSCVKFKVIEGGK